MTPHILIDVLTPVLEAAGFWRFPHMDYFVRVRGSIRDVIGWHEGHAASRYAVYFGVWVPELEPDLEEVIVDESTHIRNISLAHDLSLGDPYQLTEWWDEKTVAPERQESFLTQQIRHIALPYFDTFASIGDVAELVYHDARFHHTELEGRLFDNAMASFFNYDLANASDEVVRVLKPLQKVSPAFDYSGGYYWRRFNDGVFHIIVPQFYAAWRFVNIQVAVWHPSLDGLYDAPEVLPSAFSKVAWRSFGANGQSSSTMLPAFLGESSYALTSLDDLVEGLRSHGLVWLEGIDSKQKVYDAIRPEFRKFYPLD